MVMEDKPFPMAHIRPCLDDQFSFRSDEPIVDNADREEIVRLDVKTVVASEKWFQSPLVVVVVGASGDLARKKTYPSLFELYQHGLLPAETVIWGYARTPKTHLEFRHHLHVNLTGSQIPHSPRTLRDFLQMCFYLSGSSYGDSGAYHVMLGEIANTAALDAGEANVLYYLAIPPNVFGETVHTLEGIPNAVVPGKTRFVIEKPFGRDADSCKALLDGFQGLGEEMQYRLDHYLAKPMVENLATLRMANPWLENMMNHQLVESVHIRFKEPFGTQGRGGYFDQYNIIRDVLQNHLLQVLLLIVMDLPNSLMDEIEDDSDSFRQAKLAVLEKMPPILLEDALLGQYEGYKDDPTIANKDTNCPTYAALRCYVNSQRWKGVPFILEAGKALDSRVVDVQISFRNRYPFPPNKLTVEIQPQAKISMTTHVKPLDGLATGVPTKVSTTVLSTNYSFESGDEFSIKPIENAYCRLLLDVLRGKQNNFVRSDELVRSWEVFTPLLHQIERDNVQPMMYTYGSSGPSARAEFLEDMLRTNIKASL